MPVDGGGSLGRRLRFSARRTFPSLGLGVVFVATWRLEEAALIKTHPSHFKPPTLPPILSLFQKSLSEYREEETQRERWKKRRAHRGEERGREEDGSRKK